MRILDAALKSIWYDAILKGTKKTEYRDMTEYWINKLLDTSKYEGKTIDDIKDGLSKGTLKLYPRGWTHVRFHCKERTMVWTIEEIKTYDTHTTFAIKLGKRVE